VTKTQLIECVPNFSEGNDLSIIKQITDAIEATDGVTLLDVDPGKATNRTVVTFVGPPACVIDAAVAAARRAADLIDMRKHRGAHPRFGGLDVCPLVPISGITMEETVVHARTLARRLGDEVGLSIYCYENAALHPSRRNLASVRAGEYEGLADKMKGPDGKPDFGPSELNPGTGATAVGARDFLVAYNVNLNTTSTRRANTIAFDVRETGRVKREGDHPTGTVIKDAEGKPVWEPGMLQAVKAIGWYIEEYGVAQISMNLTNISITPVHVAFDAVCERATARGMRVTGSELVGLIPLSAMLDAGRHFLRKQQRSVGVSDRELIKIAVKSLGLDDLYPFKPEEKIIEYRLATGGPRKLVDLSLRAFVEETASESKAPGGGSVAAALGAMGAALATMVANLSSHKRGWDDRWEELSEWADRGKRLHDELLRLIDEDTNAFNAIIAANRLPSDTADEKRIREEAIAQATKAAIEVPLSAMRRALESMDVIEAMAESGNPASVSDAGVGALCARAAVMAAFLNVRINTADMTDQEYVESVLAEGRRMVDAAIAREKAVLQIVDGKM